MAFYCRSRVINRSKELRYVGSIEVFIVNVNSGGGILCAIIQFDITRAGV